MYSLILMAAMTAPADTPAWGHFNRGCDCCGYNNSCSGCYGGYAYGCGGCYGGPAYGYSGCWGSCRGCWGGCWGTGGFRTYFACHGAGACWGYAYAGGCYGFAGCYGSCYGSFNYFTTWPMPAAAPVGPPAQGAPGLAPATPPGNEPAPAKPLSPTNPGKLDVTAPANVVVTLPADAVLQANGVRTVQTGSERYFVTPPLSAGQSYHYVFTAEINRNEQQVTETYQVEVQAGLETRVNFARLIAASKPDASRIAQK